MYYYIYIYIYPQKGPTEVSEAHLESPHFARRACPVRADWPNSWGPPVAPRGRWGRTRLCSGGVHRARQVGNPTDGSPGVKRNRIHSLRQTWELPEVSQEGPGSVHVSLGQGILQRRTQGALLFKRQTATKRNSTRLERSAERKRTIPHHLNGELPVLAGDLLSVIYAGKIGARGACN